MAEAGQQFYENTNRLWVNLHTCSTGYAVQLFHTKVEEAYKYGLASVEFIYGTPDRYEGSIEQALTELVDSGQEFVGGHSFIHAGMLVDLKENPCPLPRDVDMCFAAIIPEYDHGRFKHHEYHYPLYPYRKTFSTAQIAARHTRLNGIAEWRNGHPERVELRPPVHFRSICTARRHQGSRPS